jgi:hypothetical protein
MDLGFVFSLERETENARARAGQRAVRIGRLLAALVVQAMDGSCVHVCPGSTTIIEKVMPTRL